MQAPTFSRFVDQRSRLGPCFTALDYNGKCEVGKTTVRLGSVTGRVSGCSFSNDSSGYLDNIATTRQRLGRKLVLFPGHSAALIRSTKASELILLLGHRGCQTRARCRSPRNFWKNAWGKEPSVFLHKCLDALKKLLSQTQNHDMQIIAQLPAQQDANTNDRRRGSILTAIAVSLMVLAAPVPTLTDSSLTLSNSAKADQIGQVRQVASLLEKAAEGFSKVRFEDVGFEVFDKAVTLVTGATPKVDPEALDREVDGILSGEKDIKEELMHGIMSAVENSWSTALDLVSNFNPGALSESAGASMSAFLESSAERIAAFELSTLVALGERWLIITPLVVLPMAWEMKRLNAKKEKEAREGQERSKELNEQVLLRGEKVRRELERIELRGSVLDAVGSLGKGALQPPKSREESGLIRRRIKDMLERLQDLNPVEEPMRLVPEVASAISLRAVPQDAIAYVPTTPTVDGDWMLIYVSETSEASGSQEVPQFPGIGLDNLRQKVWQAASSGSLKNDNNIFPTSPLLARNTAQIRLGPLGVFQVAVQGSWENLKDSQRALVSFNTFSARPLEIFGNKLSEDVPEFQLSLPDALKRSAEWAVAYIDDHLRINRGGRGQLFLFRKVE